MADSVIDAREIWQALQRASLALRQEAADLVAQAARRLGERVRAAYPRGPTGRLRGQIVVSLAPRQSSDPVLRTYRVRAFAPHVHIYEHGTRERVDPTRRNARRGRSPAHGPIFARLAADTRRSLIAAIGSVLARERRLG